MARKETKVFWINGLFVLTRFKDIRFIIMSSQLIKPHYSPVIAFIYILVKLDIE